MAKSDNVDRSELIMSILLDLQDKSEAGTNSPRPRPALGPSPVRMHDCSVT